jgi:hypothetical protein
MNVGRTADEVRDVGDSEVMVMCVTLDSEGTVRKVYRRAQNVIKSDGWEKKVKGGIKSSDIHIFKRIFHTKL